MEDRDYYLHRQIEELAEMLNNLISGITDCNDKGTLLIKLEEINQGLLSVLNINLEEINNISLEHFIATITVDNFVDNHNLDLLAELFYRSAIAYKILEDKEYSKRLFNRSLIIYKFLLKVETDFTYERHIRIKELNEFLLQ